MEITELNVVPFKGMLPFAFGMTEQEVVNIVGSSPCLSTFETRGSTRHFLIHAHPDQPLSAHFIRGKVVELTASPGPVPVRFCDVALLHSGAEYESLRALLSAQSDPREISGVLIFDKLGIAATGFHDANVENKSVSVFVEGHWRDVTRLPFAQLADIKRRRG